MLVTPVRVESVALQPCGEVQLSESCTAAVIFPKCVLNALAWQLTERCVSKDLSMTGSLVPAYAAGFHYLPIAC